MEKDFPVKDFIIVCCIGIFIGALGFYYLLLRPDAMKPELQMQTVLSKMKDTNSKALNTQEPASIAKAFGNTLSEAKHLATSEQIEKLIYSRFGTNQNSKSAVHWIATADHMESVDLSADREILESHPEETSKILTVVLDSLDNADEANKMIHSFQKLNFQPHEQTLFANSLLEWASNKSYYSEQEILKNYELIHFYSNENAQSFIAKLKTELGNEELKGFLQIQFPDK